VAKVAKEIGMPAMNCPCGQRLEGDTDEDFVAAVEAHFKEAHPEMAGKYTAEQILSRAE
jgi:hypothetical protein